MKKGIFVMSVSLLSPHLSDAAGKPQTPNPDVSCAVPVQGPLGTPDPVRQAYLQPVRTKAFQLPNSGTVDIGAALQPLLSAVITDRSRFQPLNTLSSNPCNKHLEISADLTDFELDIGDGSVWVGYSPTGQTGPVSNATGQVKLTIGSISMAFQVLNCDAFSCSPVVTSTSTHLTAGVSLNAVVDFNEVHTVSNFVYNTPLHEVFQAIMEDGMKKIAASPKMNLLPWQALVKDTVPNTGLFVFDAGSQSNLGQSQSFTVLAPTDTTSTGVCNVYQPVAIAHSTLVTPVSTTAQTDQTYGRAVQAGDVVMINIVPAPKQ